MSCLFNSQLLDMCISYCIQPHKKKLKNSDFAEKGTSGRTEQKMSQLYCKLSWIGYFIVQISGYHVRGWTHLFFANLLFTVSRFSGLPSSQNSCPPHVPQWHLGALHPVLVADSCPGTGPSSLLFLSCSTSSFSLIKYNILMNSFLILSIEDFFLSLLNPQSASWFLSPDPHYVQAFLIVIGLVVNVHTNAISRS